MGRMLGLVAGMLAATSTASAQIVFEALNLDKGLLRTLAGQDRAFSAVVSLRASGAEGPVESLEMRLIVRAGQMRAEVDVDHVNIRHFGADEIEMMKRAGLGQVTEIARLEKGFSYVILPLAKAYCEVRPEEIGRSAHPKWRVLEKKATGQEEVDKHPCAVNAVALESEGEDKVKLTVTTWEARDLKDFPIKIVVRDGKEERAIIQFKDVDLTPPDEWLFEPPTGWRRYPGIEQMMEERMRLMGGMFGD